MSHYTTLFERFNRWLITKAQLGYTSSTVAYYVRIIQAFLNYLNSYAISRLNDVTLDLLQTFITCQPDHSPYAPSSQRARQTALALFFSWAFQQRLCQENSFLRYRKAHLKLKPYDLSEQVENPNHLVILTDDEQQNIVQILASATTFIEKRTAAMISLILATGLHREEICQLKLQQMNWAKGTLTIEASTRDRDVKIDKAFCEKAFKNWLNARKDRLKDKPCDWLFFTERLTAMRVNQLPLYMRPLLEKAGIPPEKATADCLRQTAIYRWITKAIALEKVQAQFGFKQLASLNRYLSSFPLS